MSTRELSDNLFDWQRTLLEEFDQGNFIHFDKLGREDGLNGEATLVYTQAHDRMGRRIPNTEEFHRLLPRVKSIVVGVDIREYSRRAPEQQLFLTMMLHSRIKLAIQLLQSTTLLEAEPRIIIHTGDGAHVVFTFLNDDVLPLEIKYPNERGAVIKYLESITALENSDPADSNGILKDNVKAARKTVAETVHCLLREQQAEEASILPAIASGALSFVLALNAVLAEDGRRQRFQHHAPHHLDAFATFPLECRYAVSYDNVLFLEDVNHMKNAVGSALVTCARILSTDYGNHFLVDFELMKDLEKHGGLNALCGSQWNQSLHSALMDAVKVKSGNYRFADVFGFYDDTLLQRAMRQKEIRPKQFHIGSHNVNSLK